MAVQQIAPLAVAELDRPLGRADDVREEDRREHAIDAGSPADAGQELLDLVEDRVLVSDERKVVDPGKLDEPRAMDPLREVASALDGKRSVAGAVHDQGRDADRLERRGARRYPRSFA